MFQNRLLKNFKHFSKWARRQNLTAFRIYDRDMPEFPYVVDVYNDLVHVAEFARSTERAQKKIAESREEAIRACSEVLSVANEKIFLKAHHKNVWGEQQYSRFSKQGVTTTVTENELKFECNLTDYLDTGLFFDHRDTRAYVRSIANGKRVLNLFSYTGSFTVYAMAGNASHTTSVDLSSKYCDWARRNLKLNGFDTNSANRILATDVFQFLNDAQRERFDVIVLDPPVHSVSEKMKRTLDVQKDHAELIEKCQAMLTDEGVLIFSTNFRGFELDKKLKPEKETTQQFKPKDMRDNWHRSWVFKSN